MSNNSKSGKLVTWSLLSTIAILVAVMLFSLSISETSATSPEPTLPEPESSAIDTDSQKNVHSEDAYSVGIKVRCNVVIE